MGCYPVTQAILARDFYARHMSPQAYSLCLSMSALMACLATAEEHDAGHSRRHGTQQRLDGQLRYAVCVRRGALCA